MELFAVPGSVSCRYAPLAALTALSPEVGKTAGDRKLLGTISALDFARLRREKCGLYMASTRIWLFEEIAAWIDNPGAERVFWLMGGAGTGKSVASAMLLRRPGAERYVAHHFCLHTKPSESQPLTILKSLAAQLHATLEGFAAALASQPAKDIEAALSGSLEIEQAFAVLLLAPLQVSWRRWVVGRAGGTSSRRQREGRRCGGADASIPRRTDAVLRR